jgi:hypothetical protein
MKKLTAPKIALLEPAVEHARVAFKAARQAPALTPDWRAQMRIVWDTEWLLEAELSMPMSKRIKVIHEGVELASFFDADGFPLKAVK